MKAEEIISSILATGGVNFNDAKAIDVTIQHHKKFIEQYANQRVIEELENMVSNFTSMATYDGSDFWKMNQRIEELKTN